MRDKKILVLWPRYEPGKARFFRALLENFDCTLVFIAAGAKGMRSRDDFDDKSQSIFVKSFDRGELAQYEERGKVIFWGFPGFRISHFDAVMALELFRRIRTAIHGAQWDLVVFSTQAPLHSKFAFLLSKMKGIACGAKIEVWYDYETRNPLMMFNKAIDKFMIRNMEAAFPGNVAAKLYCERLGRRSNTYLLPYLLENFGQRGYGKRLDRFVYCGQLSKRKNADGALKAFLMSDELRKKAKFVVAGDGPLREEMQQFVASCEANDNVEFIGAYDRKSLPDILDENSVFVLASHLDCSSFATLEAVGLGRPLILSDKVGVHHDLLKDGENGYLVSDTRLDTITEAMEKLVSLSGKEAMEMQKASMEIFARHNDESRIRNAIGAALGARNRR